MNVKWDDVWKQALAAAGAKVQANGNAVVGQVQQLAQARADRMAMILEAWADHALDQATLQDELDDEKNILAMEFLAIRVMEKKAAQDAVNAMFTVIDAALLKGIELA